MIASGQMTKSSLKPARMNSRQMKNSELPDDKYWYDDAEAVRAARDDGQWVPLAHRLLWHEPLSDEARQLIASKLLNTHKKHGGRPKLTVAQRVAATPTHEAFAAYQQIARIL